jgi:CheY-like chemotaxis protein
MTLRNPSHPADDREPEQQTMKRLRILLVEDESMVAMLIEDMLADLGHEVGATASHMSEALEVARTGSFDLAIIDVNLDGEPSYPVAELLASRGIPFAFATGYGPGGVDGTFAGSPTLAKPFLLADLRRLLSDMQPALPS